MTRRDPLRAMLAEDDESRADAIQQLPRHSRGHHGPGRRVEHERRRIGGAEALPQPIVAIVGNGGDVDIVAAAMTKAVFNRSTRVARPKRTGRRFSRGSFPPQDPRGGITRSLMATPIRTNARGAALFRASTIASPEPTVPLLNLFSRPICSNTTTMNMRCVPRQKTCRAFSPRNYANSLILRVCCSIERSQSIRKRLSGASYLLSRKVMAARRAARPALIRTTGYIAGGHAFDIASVKRLINSSAPGRRYRRREQAPTAGDKLDARRADARCGPPVSRTASGGREYGDASPSPALPAVLPWPSREKSNNPGGHLPARSRAWQPRTAESGVLLAAPPCRVRSTAPIAWMRRLLVAREALVSMPLSL